jgi:hypothetical protein
MQIRCVVELEGDVFDDEGPNVVAEAVRVQVALCTAISYGFS